MNRRHLLQLGSLATLSLFLPWNKGHADEAGYGGPYLISLHAGGGWDPTLLCDAKPATDLVQQHLYSTPKTVKGVPIAPIDLQNNGVTYDDVESFFNEVGDRFLVVNGIDTQTNNHDTGVKHVWSGKTFEELPSLAAMVAAGVAEKQSLPVAYISTGGYDVTAGLVPLTRLSGGSELLRVAQPVIANPEETADNWRRYFTKDTEKRLADARAARLGRVAGTTTTTKFARSIDTFTGARASAAGFGALAGVLPPKLVTVGDVYPEAAGDAELESYLQAVQMALLGFKSRQAVSASLGTYGFDTHSNHDTDHPRQLGRLLLTIRYLLSLADQLGLTQSLYLAIGSDFGRTPTYNAGAGKDHWNVTSMMFSGPGITGGRLIGGTDDQLRPLSVAKDDPSKLLGYDDPGGTRLLPAHIQRALRQKLGLAGSALDTKYALPVDVDFDTNLLV